ncbi:hypothetical protein KC19_N032900 [Ceratodon purpureus]|nr:hypothetical protein KC19_N032900 [Ceratodon purpureus]
MAMAPSGGARPRGPVVGLRRRLPRLLVVVLAGARELERWRPHHPTFCVFKGAADGLSGGLMGSVFGFGSGLFKKQGFKGALKEGGSSAKTFAILSGVHSIVSCYLKKVRGKEDAWNAGIAGCATGLALATPGTPQALAQSCLSFLEPFPSFWNT